MEILVKKNFRRMKFGRQVFRNLFNKKCRKILKNRCFANTHSKYATMLVEGLKLNVQFNFQ